MMQIRSARWRHENRRTIRRATIAGVATVAVVGASTIAAFAATNAGSGATVGSRNGHGILLPTGQRLTPLGSQVLVDNGRLLSSSISPNGRYLAALTWNDFTGFLSIIDLQSGKIVQQVGTGIGSDKTIGDATVAADGPLWSRDGKSLWFPQTSDLVRFAVAADGTVSNPNVLTLETSVDNLTTGITSVPDLPSGMALSTDGDRLYVALNGVNKLGVIDTRTNTLTHVIKVGNAPRQVVLVGSSAYVSNEGGRPAKSGEFTNDSDGTAIVSNKTTGAASTGTVSQVDLTKNKETREIEVGLQPTAEYLAAKGVLLIANSNDDSFSVLDTRTASISQTVNVNPLPGSTVGSYPNAITMPNAHTILVSIGRDNALAEYHYSGAGTPVKYVGLLPTDFYPVGATYDSAIKKIVVTNDKGIGARGPDSTVAEGGGGTSPAPSAVVGHNTYDDTGSITTFGLPSMSALAKDTHQVFVDNGWEKLLSDKPIKNSKAAPTAIPVHLGDPSKIKHVFLIVKENRTYDQVLGDIGKGNSDPSLTQFGATITPNQHALASRFGLFDNFYDEGTLSADGHNWLMQADANDYIEKEFGAFYRSYPAQGGDALAYQRDGFLWNAAENAGNSVKAFGEYNNFLTEPSPAPSWSDYYRDSQILEGKAKGQLPVPESAVDTYSDIPSLNAIDDHEYPAFDLAIPDQYREDVWNQAYTKELQSNKVPNLSLIWMPDDHTAGVGTGDPNPVAEVADNDLAVGRMISRISHSKVWKSSAVFVLEDDTQTGADHVDGHRGPLYIASPYAKRGAIDSTTYTQLNLVKTIEQILSIAPMNQEDRAAVPMFNAFTNKPDLARFNVRPNQIPLTQGLASTSTTPSANASGKRTTVTPSTDSSGARSPVSVPAAERGVYRKWVVWSRAGKFNGGHAIVDWANPAQLNRLDWYSAHNWSSPYPGDAKILAPDEVPGRSLPNGYLGD